MAINKQQIKELLGSGLSATTVASAVGCSSVYISTLLSTPEFAEEVNALRSVSLTADSKRDSTIDGIEDKLLSRLDEMVTEGAFFKPRDILAAAATMNRMVRRSKSIGSAAVSHTTNIVSINLPPQVARKFVTNRENEVIEVEGKTLVTMPAHQLLHTLAADRAAVTADIEDSLRGEGAENNGDRYAEALKYLPSGVTSKIVDSI